MHTVFLGIVCKLVTIQYVCFVLQTEELGPPKPPGVLRSLARREQR